MTIRTADFIASQGVNVHISQGTSNYGSSADIIADLQYLNIWNLRDTYNPSNISVYGAVATAGGLYDFGMAVGGTWNATLVGTAVSSVASFMASYPGSVFAIEGPNEINNFPITWSTNGDTGINAGVDFQESMYSQARANSAFNNVLIYYFTGYAVGSVGTGPNPSTTSGLCDYNNQHPYPVSPNPPIIWLNLATAFPNETAPYGPGVYTESGYSNSGGTTIQAANTLNVLMDAANLGIYRTYLYQLMDESDGYNLFDASNAPTPAATAIHNMNTILADPGLTAKTFSPTNFYYNVTGLPASANALAFMKSDGTQIVALWDEPATFPGTPTSVTVSFEFSFTQIRVYDPLVGTTLISSVSHAMSATVSVPSHPVFVFATGEILPAYTWTPRRREL